MNDKQRAEIKERVAAMPKGHYEAHDDWSPDWWAVYVGEEEDERLVCDCTEDTATFYANAPADIRALLADNAALAQELARALEALGKLEPDYIASDEGGDYCEWCGSDSGHVDDCVFAVIAKDEEEE